MSIGALIWSTGPRKAITSVAATIAAVGGAIVAVPKTIEAMDDLGFPIVATRTFTRDAIAKDRAASIIIRDSLIALTTVRRRWLAHEIEAIRTSLVTDRDPVRRRLLDEALDRHVSDLAEVDDQLRTLRALRGH